MRHERVQAGAEGERAGHDDDREHGAEHRGAHRRGVAAAPGFEREPDPGHCGDGRRACCRRGACDLDPREPVRARCRARSGARRQAKRIATALRMTIRPANPTPITVQSNAIPRDGYTARAGPIGASGESPTATTAARSDPATTAPIAPMRPSDAVIAGLAPIARSVSRSSVIDAELTPDHLGRDQQRGEGRDAAEHAERDRFRLDRSLGLRFVTPT